MALENEILNAVRLGFGLKLEAIAMQTGFSTAHVARIMAGESRVTVEFLRAFYAKWPSPMIIRLIDPDYEPARPRPQRRPPEVVPVIRNPRDCIRHCCELMHRFVAFTETIDAIVADNKVKESEAQKITESFALEDQIHRGLAEYRLAMDRWYHEDKQGVRP